VKRYDYEDTPSIPYGDIDRWGVVGHESEPLSHDDLDEAITAFLDDVEPEHWPTELLVTGYIWSDGEPGPGEWSDLDDVCEVRVSVATWVRDQAATWLGLPDVAAAVARRESTQVAGGQPADWW